MLIYTKLVEARNSISETPPDVSKKQKIILSELAKETFLNQDKFPKKVKIQNFCLSEREFRRILEETLKKVNLTVEKIEADFYCGGEGACVYTVTMSESD